MVYQSKSNTAKLYSYALCNTRDIPVLLNYYFMIYCCYYSFVQDVELPVVTSFEMRHTIFTSLCKFLYAECRKVVTLYVQADKSARLTKLRIYNLATTWFQTIMQRCPKSQPLPNYQKLCIKSYSNLPMRLDFSVKLKQ